MAEYLNGYFSSMFTREDTSSLSVPYANFQDAKSDYLAQVIVNPQTVAKKIKAMILYHLDWVESCWSPNQNESLHLRR